MDMEMSDDEKKELKVKLLDFLGLPGNKGRAGKNVDLKKPAPRFLMNVYETLMEDGDSGRKKRSAEINLSKEEQDAIDISDLIMTFESVGEIFLNYNTKGCLFVAGKFLEIFTHW